METIGKVQLTDMLMKRTSLTRQQASEAIRALTTIVQETVAVGQRVTLPGFGSWRLTEHQARTGVNPQTKEPIAVPAHRSVRFASGSVFKALVRAPAEQARAVGEARPKGRRAPPKPA